MREEVNYVLLSDYNDMDKKTDKIEDLKLYMMKEDILFERGKHDFGWDKATLSYNEVSRAFFYKLEDVTNDLEIIRSTREYIIKEYDTLIIDDKRYTYEEIKNIIDVAWKYEGLG